jgi:HSP20 family protein
MLLTEYNPFKELRDLEDKLFNFPKIRSGELSGFTPVVNTREGEFAYHIEVDLPGVKKEDINVDVSDNMLTISGERSHKKEVKEEDYYKCESNYGKFQRSFTLPSDADGENISASSDNGVLEVTIPKLKEKVKEKKKVEIK